MKTQSFEEKISKIEELVELLEDGELSIEEMLQKYEQAVNLIKESREYINKAEKVLININDNINK